LAAAIALRQKGCAVALADCALPPIDKPCGEGLLPDSQAALRQLGVTVTAAHGYPFRGIRFIERERSVEGDFPAATGFGVRRAILQKLLIDRAEQLGVRMSWGVKGIGLRGGQLCMEGTPVRCNLVVAADGHNSTLRHAAGLDAAHRSSRRYAYRRHYAMTPWSEYLELYWGDGFQIYVTPVSSQEICVALMSRERKLRLDDGLACLPEIGQRLAGQPASSKEMGAVTVWRKLRRLTREGFALVGDAAGSVDPITGEGLRLAFQGAADLASAVEAGDLKRYERAHARMRRRTDEMAWLLTMLGDVAPLRQRVMAAFARRRGVFEGMLGVHIGAATLFDFRPAQVLDFGWQLLTPAGPATKQAPRVVRIAARDS
jgi:flavin-dependent dehydrogenase